MDITSSLTPNSKQVNADDLTQPITVTIEGVIAGDADQPVHIRLTEFPGRTYRPSKTMRRLIVASWGPEADSYTGRQMTLFRNPEIRFGKDVVGGIEISHISHIEKPLTVPLTVTRGRRKNFTVQPLRVAPSPSPTPDSAAVADWCETFNAAETVAQLQAAWEGATKAGVTGHPDVVAAKNKRKGEL